MKFGNFVFPISTNPSNDQKIIDETLDEILFCEQLGYDTVWLSEHHFDGATAYVDPVTFAAAVAAKTKRIRIGFAVVEMALHHPVRLAAQVSLLDNISKGRLIVGTGKGSAFNEYEYIGFGVPMSDSASNLEEAESLLIEAWQGDPVNFKGKYWNVSFPGLRPMTYTKPHPPIIRACLSLESTKAMARIKRPILIGAQDNQSIAERISLFRNEALSLNTSVNEVDKLLEQIWVSKNVFVGDSTEEATEIATEGLTREQKHFQQAREKFNPSGTPNNSTSGDDFNSTFIVGTPKEVSEQISELKEIGVHNLMMKMNTGEMDNKKVMRSIELFAKHVIPNFEGVT